MRGICDEGKLRMGLSGADDEICLWRDTDGIIGEEGREWDRKGPAYGKSRMGSL